MSSEPWLSVERLSASWGGQPLLRNLSFELAQGELAVLMGPNASGKTTLLRALAGLHDATAVRLELGGRSLVGSPAHQRGIGFVFQESTLFPRRSVWQNIAYGLEVRSELRRAIEARVESVAKETRVAHLLDRSSGALSGGERQRVALARALAPSPRLLLMDEPFASVDPEIRSELRAEFRRILNSMGTTAIFVTHDREEGLLMGERAMILIQGELKRVGTPEEVQTDPRSPEVARFLGFNVIVEGGRSSAVPPEEITLGLDGGTRRAVVVLSRRIGIGRTSIVRGPENQLIEVREAGDQAALPPGAEVSVSIRRQIWLPSSTG